MTEAIDHGFTDLENLVANGVDDLMEAVTDAKFAKWDRIIAEDILASGTEEQKKEVFALLEDPTIYFYAFFKDPKNPKKPFKLYPYQDTIINDPYRYILFCAANQIGKSITLCTKALYHALMNPGHTVLMVSRTFPQAKDLLLQIRQFLSNCSLDYKYDVGDTDTKTEIYFKHYEEYEEFDENLGETVIKTRELAQSRIICVPATEAALGYAVDLLLIDELAFFENGDYFYKQIALPRTYTTKGQIIIFSNPSGQQGIFWELWSGKNSPFHKYRFNFFDCPTNTQKEFDEYCYSLTQDRIDSTLLAIFTNPAGGFITVQERLAMQEERMSYVPTPLTEPIYIFFDFAKSQDRTVRTIGIPIKKEGRAVGVYAYEMKEYPERTPYSDIVQELDEFINSVGVNMVEMVGWDNTGVGRGIEDFIKKLENIGVTCVPVEFSLQNKSAIYTTFKLLIERNLRGEAGIKIPKIAECDKQLAQLRFKKTQRDLLQVHHEKESDRDDYPDSIAGLCSLIIQPDSPPVTIEFVGNNTQGRLQNTPTERCECGNIVDPWEEVCTFCGKKVTSFLGFI